MFSGILLKLYFSKILLKVSYTNFRIFIIFLKISVQLLRSYGKVNYILRKENNLEENSAILFNWDQYF